MCGTVCETVRKIVSQKCLTWLHSGSLVYLVFFAHWNQAFHSKLLHTARCHLRLSSANIANLKLHLNIGFHHQAGSWLLALTVAIHQARSETCWKTLSPEFNFVAWPGDDPAESLAWLSNKGIEIHASFFGSGYKNEKIRNIIAVFLFWSTVIAVIAGHLVYLFSLEIEWIRSERLGVWNDVSFEFPDVCSVSLGSLSSPRSPGTQTQVHAYLLLARPKHLDWSLWSGQSKPWGMLNQACSQQPRSKGDRKCAFIVLRLRLAGTSCWLKVFQASGPLEICLKSWWMCGQQVDQLHRGRWIIGSLPLAGYLKGTSHHYPAWTVRLVDEIIHLTLSYAKILITMHYILLQMSIPTPHCQFPQWRS